MLQPQQVFHALRAADEGGRFRLGGATIRLERIDLRGTDPFGVERAHPLVVQYPPVKAKTAVAALDTGECFFTQCVFDTSGIARRAHQTTYRLIAEAPFPQNVEACALTKNAPRALSESSRLVFAHGGLLCLDLLADRVVPNRFLRWKRRSIPHRKHTGWARSEPARAGSSSDLLQPFRVSGKPP